MSNNNSFLNHTNQIQEVNSRPSTVYERLERKDIMKAMKIRTYQNAIGNPDNEEIHKITNQNEFAKNIEKINKKEKNE